MRTTSPTPSMSSISRVSTIFPPTTPSTVRRDTGGAVDVEPKRHQFFHHVLNLRLAGAFLHHNNHVNSLENRPRRRTRSRPRMPTKHTKGHEHDYAACDRKLRGLGIGALSSFVCFVGRLTPTGTDSSTIAPPKPLAPRGVTRRESFQTTVAVLRFPAARDCCARGVRKFPSPV